jgi:hypothetical protein
VGIAGILALMLSPAGIATLVLAGSANILACGFIIRRVFLSTPFELSLYPDGRVQWIENGLDRNGHIQAVSWSNRRYAVISVTRTEGTDRFLISRSHQQPDTFRILLSWLVMGLPHVDVLEQV